MKWDLQRCPDQRSSGRYKSKSDCWGRAAYRYKSLIKDTMIQCKELRLSCMPMWPTQVIQEAAEGSRLHPRWHRHRSTGWLLTRGMINYTDRGGPSLKQTLKLSFKVSNQHIMWMAKGTYMSWGKAMKFFWYKLSKIIEGQNMCALLGPGLAIAGVSFGQWYRPDRHHQQHEMIKIANVNLIPPAIFQPNELKPSLRGKP